MNRDLSLQCIITAVVSEYTQSSVYIPITDNADVHAWLRHNSVSEETCNKLHKEMIRKMSDFEGMTKEDIQALGLPIGEQIRLRMSIERVKEKGKKNTKGRAVSRMFTTFKLN